MGSAGLLASLPPRAAEAVRALLACSPDSDQQMKHASSALAAVGFPNSDELVPLVETLSKPQRAVLDLISDRPKLFFGQWAIPMHRWCRQRWLGLAPPSVLERVVAFEGRKVPIWRAIVELDARRDEKRTRSAFVEELRLPFVDRLDLFIDVGLGAYGANVNERIAWGSKADIGADLGAWSAAQADRLAEMIAARETHFYPYRGGPGILPHTVQPVMLAVVRAGLAIEPRWDVLVDPADTVADVREILAKVPEPRRTPLIVARLGEIFDSWAVEQGLRWLKPFPSRELTQLVLDKCAHANRPKRDVLKDVAKIAEKSAVVQRAYDAFRGKQPKAIVLTLASDTWPKSVKELSPTQKKQLVATGQPYDGETTSAEKRFATFEGSLRIRTVASAKGKPAYDVFTYLADDGCVFLAETTELVAWFVQDSLDTQGDVALHEALQSALAGRPKKAKAAKPKKI